jgi:hypothetical protein
MHAQLTFGNGMVKFDSVGIGGEFCKLMLSPDEIGLRETKASTWSPVPPTPPEAQMALGIRTAAAPWTCRDLEGQPSRHRNVRPQGTQ